MISHGDLAGCPCHATGRASIAPDMAQSADHGFGPQTVLPCQLSNKTSQRRSSVTQFPASAAQVLKSLRNRATTTCSSSTMEPTNGAAFACIGSYIALGWPLHWGSQGLEFKKSLVPISLASASPPGLSKKDPSSHSMVKCKL